MKAKVYIVTAIILLIAALTAFSYNSYKKLKEYKAKYTTELSNRRALEAENDSITTTSELLKYKIDDISSSRDSIFQEMYKVKKELKIKDKNIKQLQYLLSTAERVDSVVVRDTLFASPDVKIDTTIGDKWISTRLKLEYPSTIVVNPSVRSEKYIVMNEVKKTIKKPSKIFFIRWFQKKYTTVDIEVVEKNPYITTEQNRFVEIIK